MTTKPDITATSVLPERPNLDFLRKEAKQRLAALKARASGARLADAQYWLAREYGFCGWQDLKAEVNRRTGILLVSRGEALAAHRARRFLARPEEDFEAAGFLPGAAATPIGVTLTLLAVALMFFWFAGAAFAQAPDEALHAEQMRPRTAISLDPARFDRFAGSYQMGPHRVLTLKREGDRFFAGATGQPQSEIFPESTEKFFLKNVPAQISFTLTGDQVTGLVLHQGGREIAMPRLDDEQARALASLPAGHPMPRNWMALNLEPRILTTVGNGTFDYWPCFSPDGKTILFSRSVDRGKTWALYRMAAAGGAAQKIPLPVSANRPSWQGGTIAFTAEDREQGGLWVMQADGSGAKRIAPRLIYPSWYPDGRALAAMDPQGPVLRQVMLAGGESRPLTDKAQLFTGMPSVSPDGKAIVFAGQTNAGQVYDQNENMLWLLEDGAAPRPVEARPVQGRAPVWSPDGRRIAFESDRGDDQGRYAVFLINRDGTGLVQVTDFARNATHPVFSPDGRRLVMAYGTPMTAANGVAVVELPPSP